MEGKSFLDHPLIPGYEPIRFLGFECINPCTIYLARDSSSGGRVALKVWRLEDARPARGRYAPSTRLRHPNIIRVLEMREFEGKFLCALEYFDHTLADRLREGPLPDLEAARVARAVGSALQYAWDQGMAPRSLSPNSILVTEEGVPKLLDFCRSETFGRPPYLPPPALLPPECVSGADPTSEASQVYRVGALMYELVTATPPFTGDYVATLKQVLHEMPQSPRTVNPRVGLHFDAVCRKCLEKDPKERYASLQDLVDDLELFCDGAGAGRTAPLGGV